MKLCLLLALATVASGHPLIVEDLMTKHLVTENVLKTPMTELDYETLLPAVTGTVNELLHATIPNHCLDHVIPYMTIGIVRTMTFHKLRDIASLLEGKSVRESLILDTLNLPSTSPINTRLIKLNEEIQNIRHRMHIDTGVHHSVTLENVHLTPTQLRTLVVFETVANVYLEQVEAAFQELRMDEKDLPFEKFIVAMTTTPMDIQTYWNTMTLEEYLTFITRHTQTLLKDNFTPELCNRHPVTTITSLVTNLQNLMQRMANIQISDLMTRVTKQRTLMDDLTLETLLEKVLPVMQDATSTVRILKALKVTHYQTAFMRLITNFTCEFLVTETMQRLNTMTTARKFLVEEPDLLTPLINDLSTMSRTEKTVTFTKMLAKMAVVMRTKGMMVTDIMDTLTLTLNPQTVTGTNAGTHDDVMTAGTNTKDTRHVLKASAGTVQESWEYDVADKSEIHEATIGEFIRRIITKIMNRN